MAYDENGNWVDDEELLTEEEAVSDQEKRKLELLKYQSEPAPQPLQAYAQAPSVAQPPPSAAPPRRGAALPTEAELSNKNIPVGERFNNPFNMWHDKYAAAHGGADPAKMVTPQDRPASFPSKLDGAAAAIQKMAQSPLYRNKTMTDLIGQWVGHGDSYAPIIEKATGISRNTPITPEFLQSEQGLTFLKTMARYETKWEQPYPLSDAEWRAARDKAFGAQVSQGNPQVRWVDQLQSTANQLNNANIKNEPRNAADLYAYLAKDKNLSHVDNLSPALHNRLAALIAAAPPEIRNKITIDSGYRSEARQAELFKAAVIKYGSEAAARHWVAPPGKSQHNFGNAADLGFSKDPRVVKWVHENAPAYGLRFRMGHEKWHIEPSDAGGVPSGGTVHVDQTGDYGTIDPDSVANMKSVPSGVSHTEGEFPPTEGEQALVNATNPTLYSTMLNYNWPGGAPTHEPLPNVVEGQPAASPQAEPTFMEKLTNLARWASPVPDESGTSPLGQVLSGIKRNIDEFGQGGASGVQDLPGQMIGGPATAITAAVGALSGSDNLTREALQGAADLEKGTRDAQTRMGMNPDELTPAQYWGHQVGSNLGLGVAKTLVNTGLGYVASKVIGPSSQYMAQHFPIPNINPISTAQAADPSDVVFGKPPMVIMTPAGPQTMNAADAQQLAWGGILALAFGASFPVMAKSVKVIRTLKPAGLEGVFDPRRPVHGAPGTEAVSIPLDSLKAGTLDQGTAMRDLAWRHYRLEKGTSVGYDPAAADAVLQRWRIQTNSGAQTLISSALREGEMNAAPDFQFKVRTSIGKLAEWASTPKEYGGGLDTQFAEYLRLRVIQEEIRNGVRATQGLPSKNPRMWQPTAAQGGGPALPYTTFQDGRTGAIWNQMNIGVAVRDLENAHPQLARAYTYYQENLQATRDFVSTHKSNAREDPIALRDAAVQRPTMPIFAHSEEGQAHANYVHSLFDKYLSGREHPLKIVEAEMSKAFDKQMRFDAEQHYIEASHQNVGDKAFTPREAWWATGPDGGKARDGGALLTRKRNGKTEYWTADPLLVHMMNSGHIPLAGMDHFFATSKNVFQKTTTGFWAPSFAPTGGIRAMEQGWTTAPGGIRTAAGKPVYPSGPIASIMGIAKQVGPRSSKSLAQFFRESLATTNWGRTLTLGQADLIGRSFEKWYMDSYYRRLEVAGAFGHNPVLEGHEVARSIVDARRTYGNHPMMNPVIDYMEKVTHGFTKLFWGIPKKLFYTSGNALLTSIQEGAQYEMARKTLKGSDATNRPTVKIGNVTRELTDAEVGNKVYRNYTGDPSTRGYYKDKKGNTVPFHLGDGPSPGYAQMNAVQRGAQDVLRATWPAQAAAVTAASWAVHQGRTVFPWSGVLLQSPAATLAALRDNPVRANFAFTMSAVMPEITAYLWNSYWSNVPVPIKDENGNPVLDTQGRQKFIKYDYVNHSVNGRNSYQVDNNVYWAVWPKAPWDGMEFRHYQETSFPRHMAKMWMHQVMGKAYGSMYDDTWDAIWGMLGTAVVPPMPPVFNAVLGSKGLVSTGGFLGNIFKSRRNPYMDLGGGESNTELFLRAVGPSISDMILHAYQAGISAPDRWTGIKAAGSDIVHRLAGKTAIIGDLTGDAGSRTGSPIISEKLWENKKIIDDLSRRYRFDMSEGISTKRGSNEGRKLAYDYIGDLPPSIKPNMIAHPGLPLKEPTNPLYKLLIEEIEQVFNRDEPKKGGIGFKSMWGMYGIYGQLYNEMRPIYRGNDAAWIESQKAKPEDMQWFRERNVNPIDQDAVRNFYQAQRNRVTEKILQTIIAVEQKMSKRPDVMALTGGKPFKINMLDPYKLGIKTPGEDDYQGDQ